MKRAFIECHNCGHLFFTQNIHTLSEIIDTDVAYSCRSCGDVMGLWSVHFCSRDLGDGHCDNCKFRFPCFTECATEKA